MRAVEHCITCLRGLAERTLLLSCGGNRNSFSQCCTIIDTMIKKDKPPSVIASKLLKYIKKTTGVYDPYVFLKEKELRTAKKAFEQLADSFPDSLEGVIKLSALGNSLDFFTNNSDGFNASEFSFYGNMDIIENEIYIKGKDVLILGDNVGDFIFDIPLIDFFENKGKRVHYAVKEHPVQNDLSMPDVQKFEFIKWFGNIISTSTDEVGIRLEEMTGKLKNLWETDTVIIAKGMGNYETISEYSSGRPVIHIMKVKCPAVAMAIGYKKGTYVAKLC